MERGTTVAPRAQPFFLPAAGGQRFCLYHPPAGDCRGALLYLHPFGDEMNKARRMAALQARAVAARGYGVLQIDLHGCGDSSGEFGDATWDSWKADVTLGCAWLKDKLGQPVGLWGLRLGALLALDHARTAAETPARLLLWQPVTGGAAFLTQILRLRVANEMFGDKDDTRDGAKEKSGGTKALREALRGGEALEVAGYDITPSMADSLDALDASKMIVTGCPVDWIEVVAAPERPLSVAGARLADAWRTAGVALHVELVACLPFWATQEISECPPMIAATSARLASPFPCEVSV